MHETWNFIHKLFLLHCALYLAVRTVYYLLSSLRDVFVIPSHFSGLQGASHTSKMHMWDYVQCKVMFVQFWSTYFLFGQNIDLSPIFSWQIADLGTEKVVHSFSCKNHNKQILKWCWNVVEILLTSHLKMMNKLKALVVKNSVLHNFGFGKVSQIHETFLMELQLFGWRQFSKTEVVQNTVLNH